MDNSQAPGTDADASEVVVRYASIIFLQDGEEADEVVDKLANVEGVVIHGATEESITEAIAYLSRWDYGDESEYDLREEPSQGSDDHVAEVGDYILSWNAMRGTVGLQRKVYGND